MCNTESILTCSLMLSSNHVLTMAVIIACNTRAISVLKPKINPKLS